MKMRKMKKKIISLLLTLVVTLLCVTGCNSFNYSSSGNTESNVVDDILGNVKDVVEDVTDDIIPDINGITSSTTTDEQLRAANYTGSPYITVNGNEPYFTDEEKTSTEAFEKYANLDLLGRCGTAYANICKELMPTEERGDIDSVKPTGWKNNSYDFVDGNWVYNRCHIIGFQLAGENANEKNLITGTRYMNVQGMLPFENMIDDYVDESGNHVLYRVTPIFNGSNLLCEGVLMEAWSVEDNGDGICFNVFCYNVQPGVEFNYATGENWASGDEPSANANTDNTSTNSSSEKTTYILNTNSKKFHSPDCSSVAKTSEKNKQEYTGTREELIEDGYTPCGSCNP